jgi:hypothetical protein
MSFVNVINASGTISSGTNLSQSSAYNFYTNSSLTNTSLNTGGIDISGNINSLTINSSNSIYGGGGGRGERSSSLATRFGRNGGHSIKIESSIQVSNITNLGILCGGGGGGQGNSINVGNYGGAGGGGGAAASSLTTITETSYGGSDSVGGSGTSLGTSGGGGGFGYSGGTSDTSGYATKKTGGTSSSSGNLCNGGSGGLSLSTGENGGDGTGYGGGGGGSSGYQFNKAGGGGGGAGCGGGGLGNAPGGGGSGGGIGGNYKVSAAFLGGGGYSIFNLGTLTTLENLQGTTSRHGPLFIAGNMPNTYSIIIQDASYGQLANTGWYAYTNNPNGISLQNFAISTQSTNVSSGIYYSVLTGITPQTLSGSQEIINGVYKFTYNWTLSPGTSVVMSGETYQTYDLNLTVTKDLACFLESSKILTNNGYKVIEELKIGDLVKTLYHDFKSVKIIGKSTILNLVSEERIKNQLYRCPQRNFPELFEDLIITGCHSILVDNFSSNEQLIKTKEVNGDIYITDNKYRLPACLDERTCVYRVGGTHNVYHIALENDDLLMNYGIFANGLLVESSSIWSLKEKSKMELIE